MLLQRLFARDTPGPDVDLAFRTRGAEVSRLEGFSDAVFGFGITILVISGKAPDTAVELMGMWHAVLPFCASFLVLFVLWRAQFDFFRRYGLEDRRTIRLTGLLLMTVLLAIYPLKFLTTFILDVLPGALIAGNDSMKSMTSLRNLPKILLMYAVGSTVIAYLFSRLYRHAATQHAVIGLSQLELFDTGMIERRWQAIATGGTALVAWCLLVIVLDATLSDRTLALQVGEALGILLIVGTNIVQRRALRRLARERVALTTRLAAPGGRSSGAPA